VGGPIPACRPARLVWSFEQVGCVMTGGWLLLAGAVTELD
jgi:hypothetical protein